MVERVPSIRSFLWRLGVGAPPTRAIREALGRVAARLEHHPAAERAARVLGLPGLYRSPTCWGGSALRPKGFRFDRTEWAMRCQAASFEVAVRVGPKARPFLEDHAYGPLPVVHGLALRALLRLDAATDLLEEDPVRPWERILELEPYDREVALDALRVDLPRARRVRSRFATGLERFVERALDARSRLLALDPLARLAPDKARRFLPELRRMLAREGQHALEAALLVRALDPRDHEAWDLLRHFAAAHPDPHVRAKLEARLKPPHPVAGTGLA